MKVWVRVRVRVRPLGTSHEGVPIIYSTALPPAHTFTWSLLILPYVAHFVPPDVATLEAPSGLSTWCSPLQTLLSIGFIFINVPLNYFFIYSVNDDGPAQGLGLGLGSDPHK